MGLLQLQIFLVYINPRDMDCDIAGYPTSNVPHQEHFHWEHDTIGL